MKFCKIVHILEKIQNESYFEKDLRTLHCFFVFEVLKFGFLQNIIC